jgi:PAS domain S-box-containing protein
MAKKPTYEELEQRVKELEAERSVNESALDRLFHLSIDMLCVADIDGYFRHINKAFEKTLGYTKRELLKEPFIHFVHPDDVASTMAAVDQLSHGQPVIYFENRYRCKDGSYKWLAWTSMPVPEEGLTYGVGRDVTEQKN